MYNILIYKKQKNSRGIYLDDIFCETLDASYSVIETLAEIPTIKSILLYDSQNTHILTWHPGDPLPQ